MAKRRLQELVLAPGFEIERGDPKSGRIKDRYGRTLATIYVCGIDFGLILFDEGLPETGAANVNRGVDDFKIRKGIQFVLFYSLNHFKSAFVYQSFIGPADDDYLTARWLFINGFSGFYWSAAQSVEKYLKASLLLNGFSYARGSSHNLSDLYAKYAEVYERLVDREFVRPIQFDERLWRQISVQTYVARLNEMGDPNGRYGLTNWHMQPDDLIKFDLLCKSLRRCCACLDWIVDQGIHTPPSLSAHKGKTFRQVFEIDSQASLFVDFKQIDRELVSLGINRKELRAAWNYAWLEQDGPDFDRKPLTITAEIGWMKNSYISILHNKIIDIDSNGVPKKLSPILYDGAIWLIDNVMLGKELVKEWKALLKPDRVADLEIDAG